MASLFDLIEVQYDKLNTQVNTYLSNTYNRASILLSSASPYGQILDILKKFFQNSILYGKQASININIEETTDPTVIKSIARISGHNSTRSISAKGTLKFKLKPGISITDKIKGGYISINNNTLIKNLTNNLNYTIKLGADNQIFQITPNCEFYVSVVQGKYDAQTYTGDGTIDQSLQVSIPRNNYIDNFDFTVKYNGIELIQRDHMFDMLPGEFACYTKTGFNGGLDIYFGNTNFGFIPQPSSILNISYLLTNGTAGNIVNNDSVSFKFIDIVTDGQGNDINMEETFDISIETDINFASDGETTTFTKNIIPYVSRNFVLATANQFIYHLKRLNVFSIVMAYNVQTINTQLLNSLVNPYTTSLNRIVNSGVTLEELNQIFGTTNITDNTIFLYLVPRIDQFISGDINYFNIPLDALYLSNDEKTKTINYLQQLAILSMTTTIQIIQPNISRYVMNVHIRNFSDINQDNIRQSIITLASNYFVNNTRHDRIVKADIISQIVDNVIGVDSVDIDFVSEENENYYLSNPGTNNVIGLDPMQGDILIDTDRIVVVRGGFKDRNGLRYKETVSTTELGAINIYFDGVTQRNINKS